MENDKKIVDPHHHIWNLETIHYPWLMDKPVSGLVSRYPHLATNYSLSDYRADASPFNLVKSVHIEALPDPDEAVVETAWLQAQADDPSNHGFPHGIVAFADLSAANFADVIAGHSNYTNFRGIRQGLSWEIRPYLREDKWCANFKRLGELGLSFDMQINPGQMQDAKKLASDNPDIQIVLDHTGMPEIKNSQGVEQWRSGMSLLASCQNVAVKISGFGMFDANWTVETIRPFVVETIDLFGPSRCMFASNFPVDRVFKSFSEIWAAFFQIADQYSEEEKSKMFHDNAVFFYRL